MHLLRSLLFALVAAAATKAQGYGAPEDDPPSRSKPAITPAKPKQATKPAQPKPATTPAQPKPATTPALPNHVLHGATGAATGFGYKIMDMFGRNRQQRVSLQQPDNAGRTAPLLGEGPIQGVASGAGPLRTQVRGQNSNSNPNPQPIASNRDQGSSSGGGGVSAGTSDGTRPQSDSTARRAKVPFDQKPTSYQGTPMDWTVDQNIADVNRRLKKYKNTNRKPLIQWQICMKKKIQPKGWTLAEYFKEQLKPEEMEEMKRMEDDCIDEVNAESVELYAGQEEEETTDDEFKFSSRVPALKPSPNPVAAVSAWAACVQKCTLQGGADIMGSIPRCFDPIRCRSPFGDVNLVNAASQAYWEHRTQIEKTATVVGVGLAVAMLIWFVLTSLAAAGVAVAAAAVAAGVGAVISAS